MRIALSSGDVPLHRLPPCIVCHTICVSFIVSDPELQARRGFLWLTCCNVAMAPMDRARVNERNRDLTPNCEPIHGKIVFILTKVFPEHMLARSFGEPPSSARCDSREEIG